ncbi:MAG TPA: hypothetical protein VKU90_06555 [Caulobacteraceae bacterium]|nr:hypothetical protein [Caulobacteraceae bacterium]
MAKRPKQSETPAQFNAKDKERIYTTFAVATFLAAIGILVIIAWLARPGGPIVSFVSVQFIALLLAAVVAVAAGLLFLDASNPSAPDVILPADRALLSKTIEAGNEQAVTQYLRLRNMRGVTGFFQKLGLPGLPVATIFVTLLFTLLAVSVSEPTTRAALFDLAKLTLGAFIGSFVQRSIDPSVHPVTTGKGRDPDPPPAGNLTGNTTTTTVI